MTESNFPRNQFSVNELNELVEKPTSNLTGGGGYVTSAKSNKVGRILCIGQGVGRRGTSWDDAEGFCAFSLSTSHVDINYTLTWNMDTKLRTKPTGVLRKNGVIRHASVPKSCYKPRKEAIPKESH